MPAYADTSFLVRAYTPHAGSQKALTWLQNAREPLPFTPLHRHELRNAIRLRVFRGEITPEQRKLAFQEIESDLLRNRGHISTFDSAEKPPVFKIFKIQPLIINDLPMVKTAKRGFFSRINI